MNILHILIFLLGISILEAKRNNCCPEGENIIRKKGCSKNGTLWHKQNCKNGQAYSQFPSENTVLNENDDVLLLYDNIVHSDSYCVGQMGNDTIILVCFPSESNSINWSNIAVSACIFLSTLSLLVTLVIYIILPRLRDLQGKCIMYMIICLLVNHIFVIPLRHYTSFPPVSCYLVATITYFSFLGTFFWMNIIGFHIWRSIINPSYPENNSKTFKIYSLYGWGCPLLLLLIATVAHWSPGDHIKPNWGKNSCWFSEIQGTVLYFHIPLLIIIGINIILFILAIIALRKQTDGMISKKYRSRKYKCILGSKLFLTMGLCWIFEPLESITFASLKDFWFFTNFLNALQGVAIFLILIVFRKRVRRELGNHKGMCCRKLPEDWATIAAEDCEEISEEAEKLTNTDINESL